MDGIQQSSLAHESTIASLNTQTGISKATMTTICNLRLTHDKLWTMLVNDYVMEQFITRVERLNIVDSIQTFDYNIYVHNMRTLAIIFQQRLEGRAEIASESARAVLNNHRISN